MLPCKRRPQHVHTELQPFPCPFSDLFAPREPALSPRRMYHRSPPKQNIEIQGVPKVRANFRHYFEKWNEVNNENVCILTSLSYSVEAQDTSSRK